MSSHRKARGMRTQLLVAEHMRVNGWPFATSAGAGRSGSDVLNTPDVAVEVKAEPTLPVSAPRAHSSPVWSRMRDSSITDSSSPASSA